MNKIAPLLLASLSFAGAVVYIRSKRRSATPRLVLVGAGPGDCDLMTFAAAHELAKADVVIADLLIPKALLARFVPASAKLLIANKIKGNAHEAQSEIEKWTLDALKNGQYVVRLKGGDPFLYGRGGEEVVEFSKLGYQVKVVPGVSSALAGPASAGIPVTSRGVANQLAVCTVHGKNDTIPALIPKPFNPQRTVVFLMSVSRVEYMVTSLLREGYPKDTRVVVAERATLPNQRSLFCELETLTSLVEAELVQSPAVIIVGGAANGVPGMPLNVKWEEGMASFSSRCNFSFGA